MEKNPQIIERYPKLPVTLDVKALNGCNKVLCTGTTVQNDTLEEVLLHCSAAEHISVLGPTAGYFPDPLFARGVHVLGGAPGQRRSVVAGTDFAAQALGGGHPEALF